MNRKGIRNAFITIAVLTLLLTINVIVFFDNALGGPNQVALLICALLASVFAFKQKKPASFIVRKIYTRVKSAFTAIGILLLIGALSGTWLMSGIVPAFIYYGVGLISPSYFLITSVLVCSIVSVATGSSWSTIATIGIALNGIGSVMGIHPGLVAGAVISGAYFGDKISPLSDTTNLASAMTQTDLFVHIRYMLYTTVPSMLVTLILFLMIGLNYDYANVESNIADMKNSIQEVFVITPWLLLVPAILIILIVSKVKALPAMIVGVALGGVFALIFQQDLLLLVSGETNAMESQSFLLVVKSVFTKIHISAGNVEISDLLYSGGMWGMKNTVLLIICAMIFSGAMEAADFLERLAEWAMQFAKTTGSLVLSTVLTSIFFNVTASDQYIAIVVPGRMYSELYRKKGIRSEVLSRSLEDAGTETSVLVPWNTCGATQSTVLGVSVLTYLPFCFFNILSPVFSVLWAYLNVKIRRIQK